MKIFAVCEGLFTFLNKSRLSCCGYYTYALSLNVQSLWVNLLLIIFSHFMDKIKLPYFELDLCRLCSLCGGLNNLFCYLAG